MRKPPPVITCVLDLTGLPRPPSKIPALGTVLIIIAGTLALVIAGIAATC